MQDVLFAFVRLSTSDATKYNLFSWVAKTELSFSDKSENYNQCLALVVRRFAVTQYDITTSAVVARERSVVIFRLLVCKENLFPGCHMVGIFTLARGYTLGNRFGLSLA